MRTEAIEAGLDARKACIKGGSVVGNYVSTAEVRLTTQTDPSHPRPGVGGFSTPRRSNAKPGGGFRAEKGEGASGGLRWVSGQAVAAQAEKARSGRGRAVQRKLREVEDFGRVFVDDGDRSRS
ncbi:MAG: hypothetical protein ACOX9B_14175 [Candidatus Xenobium sp.]